MTVRIVFAILKNGESLYYQKGVSPFFKIAKTQSYQQAKLWINCS